MFVCGFFLVYDTVSLRPPAVSPRGREESAAVYTFVGLFFESLHVCLCVFAFGALHSQIAAQAGSLFNREGEE